MNGGVFDSIPEKKEKADGEDDEDDQYLALVWAALERQRDVYRRTLEDRLEEYFRLVAARIAGGERAEKAFSSFQDLLANIIKMMWSSLALVAYNQQKQVFLGEMSSDSMLDYMLMSLDTDFIETYAQDRASQLTKTSLQVFHQAEKTHDIHQLMLSQFLDRIAVIANREVVGAQSYGFAEAAKDLPEGNVVEKTWLTQRDLRVRDTHVGLEGVKIPVDEIFSNGCYYPGDPEGPPDEVINCRCGLIYTLIG